MQAPQVSSVPRAPPQPCAQLVRFQQVAAGEAHSAAIDSHGHLYTWGFGGSGALGHGVADISVAPGSGSSMQNSPRRVAHFHDAGMRVQKVSRLAFDCVRCDAPRATSRPHRTCVSHWHMHSSIPLLACLVPLTLFQFLLSACVPT